MTERTRTAGRARTLLSMVGGREESAFNGLAADVARDLLSALDELEATKEGLASANFIRREVQAEVERLKEIIFDPTLLPAVVVQRLRETLGAKPGPILVEARKSLKEEEG